MAISLPNGALVAIASGYGPVKTMSAITNANPGVATLEASHGIVAGDFFEVTSGWSRLTDKIIKAAQSATRITAQVQEPENEKYFARSWLLRLGMGGADFKDERRILLGGLKGHAAFPNDAAATKHKEKYAALRREAHTADWKEDAE